MLQQLRCLSNAQARKRYLAIKSFWTSPKLAEHLVVFIRFPSFCLRLDQGAWPFDAAAGELSKVALAQTCAGTRAQGYFGLASALAFALVMELTCTGNALGCRVAHAMRAGEWKAQGQEWYEILTLCSCWA